MPKSWEQSTAPATTVPSVLASENVVIGPGMPQARVSELVGFGFGVASAMTSGLLAPLNDPTTVVRSTVELAIALLRGS